MQVALIRNIFGTIPESVTHELTSHGIVLDSHECMNGDEVAAFACDAEVIWDNAGSNVISAECLHQLPRCRVILRTGSGTDNLPVKEATALGIIVANTPEAIAETVAEHTMAMLLAAVRNLVQYDRNVRAGKWRQGASDPATHLCGRTLGFVGFGRIARHVARMLGGFRMTLLAFDPNIDASTIAEHGARKVELDELLSASDFATIHTPLTNSTHHLIGEAQLKRMQPHAVLVNVARGPVVDEAALVRALTNGWIGGAAMDVFEIEPAVPNNALFTLPNVVLTPHIASYSDQFADQFWSHSVRTLIEIAHGDMPLWVANPDVTPRQVPNKIDSD